VPEDGLASQIRSFTSTIFREISVNSACRAIFAADLAHFFCRQLPAHRLPAASRTGASSR
jgi:hypothetical protein